MRVRQHRIDDEFMKDLRENMKRLFERYPEEKKKLEDLGSTFNVLTMLLSETLNPNISAVLCSVASLFNSWLYPEVNEGRVCRLCGRVYSSLDPTATPELCGRCAQTVVERQKQKQETPPLKLITDLKKEEPHA